jgi:DNA-3-methyladenine glycosylase I
MPRCPWPGNNELMIAYHDTEWGVPLHDDRKLFEFIVLDTFQAGLSWSIVLNKREGFRKALANFEPVKIARFDKRKIERLINDPAIVRNRLKIAATVNNAKAFLKIQKEFGSFDKYIWQFVDHKPINNIRKTLKQIPAKTKESDAMSKALKERGFSFVGSTICYAFMQAAGLINDHLVICDRYEEVHIL